MNPEFCGILNILKVVEGQKSYFTHEDIGHESEIDTLENWRLIDETLYYLIRLGIVQTSDSGNSFSCLQPSLDCPTSSPTKSQTLCYISVARLTTFCAKL